MKISKQFNLLLCATHNQNAHITGSDGGPFVSSGCLAHQHAVKDEITQTQLDAALFCSCARREEKKSEPPTKLLNRPCCRFLTFFFLLAFRWVGRTGLQTVGILEDVVPEKDTSQLCASYHRWPPLFPYRVDTAAGSHRAGRATAA